MKKKMNINKLDFARDFCTRQQLYFPAPSNILFLIYIYIKNFVSSNFVQPIKVGTQKNCIITDSSLRCSAILPVSGNLAISDLTNSIPVPLLICYFVIVFSLLWLLSLRSYNLIDFYKGYKLVLWLSSVFFLVVLLVSSYRFLGILFMYRTFMLPIMFTLCCTLLYLVVYHWLKFYSIILGYLLLGITSWISIYIIQNYFIDDFIYFMWNNLDGTINNLVIVYISCLSAVCYYFSVREKITKPIFNSSIYHWLIFFKDLLVIIVKSLIEIENGKNKTKKEKNIKLGIIVLINVLVIGICDYHAWFVPLFSLTYFFLFIERNSLVIEDKFINVKNYELHFDRKCKKIIKS